MKKLWELLMTLKTPKIPKNMKKSSKKSLERRKKEVALPEEKKAIKPADLAKAKERLKEDVEEKRKLEQIKEERLREAISSDRPRLRNILLMAALIAPAPGEAVEEPRPEVPPKPERLLAKEEPYEIAPYPHPDRTPIIVEPQPLEELRKGEVEPMAKEEIEIMQKGMPQVVEHFLNPTLHRYLEEEGLNNLLNSLKMAIKHFDQLNYVKVGGTVEIKKRPSSLQAEIPDDLKIVIKNNRIAEINDKTLDLNKYDDWETVRSKIFQYTEELNREEAEPFYRAPADHVEYEAYSYFNLDKFIFEYLNLRGGLTEEEKAQIDENLFRKAKQRSREHREGNGRIVVRPFRSETGQTIINISSTVEDDFRTLLNISPDGRIFITRDEGETYEKVGPENLFAELYKQRVKAPPKEPVSAPSVTRKEAPKPREAMKILEEAERLDEERVRKAMERAQKEAEKLQKPDLMFEVYQDPKIIPKLLKNPDIIKDYALKGNEKHAEELIEHIKKHLKKPGIKKGIVKLKNDIRKGTLKLPRGITQAEDFLNKYFPGVSLQAAINMGKVYEAMCKKSE